jgi:proteasome lid subunit RPN8/RPN11
MELLPYHADIVLHADKCAPRECCGLVIRDPSGPKALPLPNVSSDPENSFLLNPRAYVPYLNAGTLLEYYHSHPKDDESFSPADLRMSESAGFPVVVFSVVTRKFSRYVPHGVTQPLLGRRFHYGVFDCATLVEDYYRLNLGIAIPASERTASFLEKGVPDLLARLKAAGFELVAAPLKKHDILGFSLATPTGDCNHLAVYLGDGIMLHQLVNNLSGYRVYGGAWVKNLVYVARHSTLL